MRQTLNTPDGPMEMYVARPSGAPKGAVVVIQEAFGVNSHIEDVCKKFATEGYLAVAPDMFHRSETRLFAYDDLKSVMPVMMSLTREAIDNDLDAAFAFTAAEGFAPSNTAITGFCMGGSITLLAAGTRKLGAAVTYYGGGVGTGRFGVPSGYELGAELKTPWLGHYGDLDKGIPVDEVEHLRTIIAQQPVPAEIVRYADVDHGFNCNERDLVYNADAAASAWKRTLEWFATHMH